MTRRTNNAPDAEERSGRFSLPNVIVCKELPQWITSSDTAAFHPASNTIYIREDQGLRVLAHEYGHWLGCLLRLDWIHRWLDRR